MTHWKSNEETIDQWLERERKACEEAENPTCPYCKFIHTDWTDSRAIREEWELEGHELECADCGKPFLCDKETQVRFETRPK